VNKNIIIWMLLLICLFSMIALGQEILDGVVAIVGEEIVLRSEIVQGAQAFALRMGINPMTEKDAFSKLKLDLLNNMINEKVLLAKAREDTITVEDQQVEAELENKIQEMIQQLGSKEKVEAYFGSPIRKIKRDYREDVRKNLIAQRTREEKIREVTISRREVELFYESMKDSLPAQQAIMKIRHIMLEIKPGDKAQKAVMERLIEIQGRLRKGEAFQELAKIYSEDPGTAPHGGDLGFVERGTLFQSFEEVAFQLKPGEISDVVQTPAGLHLIQMLEKRGDRVSLRHILIRLQSSENDEKEVIQKANQLRARALAGEEFAELAKEYSNDVTSKDDGGDLGWLPLDQFQIEAFKAAVDTLQEGEISEPFLTQFGYHIVKLEGKKGERPISLEDDWDQIMEWAWGMKRQRILNTWIESLKENVYIEIKEDMI